MDGNDTDFAIVEWAVAGHHPAQNHESPPRSCPAGAGAELRVPTNHPDLIAALVWLKKTFRPDSSLPPFAHGQYALVGIGNAYQRLAKWSRDALDRWDSMRKTDDAKLVPAVKNCLVAADVAGSALPKHGSPDWKKIMAALQSIPPADDLAFLAEYGLEGHAPRTFQTDVRDRRDDVVFVKAGCGTGKTVAAYMRAAERWKGKRLYFCYPTTGTATEGFKDYLHPQLPEKGKTDTPQAKADRERLKKIDADLFHSRSGVDFEIILSTDGDSGKPDADAAVRAEALDAWATPVVACTVDAVLGIVQNNKRGLFGWPALAQSAFVFDEIHAYDDRLFGALLRFLRDVPGVPALLMTASLPKAREEALKDVLLKFRGIDLKPIPGPEKIEGMARYHKAPNDGRHLEVIAAEVKRGGKVLWVSNTVKRVMEAAGQAEDVGLRPLIYHSRFKYEDRVKRHKEVVDAFTPEAEMGVLACTSQVCEMSLDLKGCTLLVTESAPVPALIQRLGRLNRHAKDGDPTQPFIVLALDPKDHMPYTPDDLKGATAWLAKLPAEEISQRMLADAWEQSAENPPDLVPSAWLDGGPTTTVSELREPSPGVTVLMDTDLARIERPSDLGKYTLPMPPPPKAVDWKSRKHKGIPVVEAETITYDSMRGAAWKKI